LKTEMFFGSIYITIQQRKIFFGGLDFLPS